MTPDPTIVLQRYDGAVADDDPDANLKAQVAELQKAGVIDAAKATEITSLIDAGKTADADQLQRGRAMFTKHCATCHTLFDEGGKTGPNLTGYERDNIDFLLLSVVDPSAAIRDGIEAATCGRGSPGCR